MRLVVSLVLGLSVGSSALAGEQDSLGNLPTYKQEVVASQGVVATNHPLASAAGQMMLAQGGNAVDAIVAAYFVLSVVEPEMSSPFGSGFVNLFFSTTPWRSSTPTPGPATSAPTPSPRESAC